MEIERGGIILGVPFTYMQQEWAIKKKQNLETHWSDFTEFFLLVFHHRYRTCKSQGRKSPWRETNKSNKFHVRRGGGGGGSLLLSTSLNFFQIKFQGKRTRQVKSRHSSFHFFFCDQHEEVGKVWDGWRRTKEKQNYPWFRVKERNDETFFIP